MSEKKRIFYIVNVDWFFLSHRLPLALEMKKLGYEVFILAKDTGKRQVIESYGLFFIDIDFERSGKNPLKEIMIVYNLFRSLRMYRPLIVHNVTIKPALYSTIASKISGKNGVKVVNAISGLGYNFIGGRNGIVQKILRGLMNYAFARDVNFIFQNPDDLNVYQNLGYLGQNNYRLIKGAGVDGREFLESEPLQKAKLHVVLTARMLKDKGIMEFAQAARTLESKWKSKVLFRLIGDLDEHNPAAINEDEMKLIQIPDYLVWEGYQNDVKSVLVESDIVCLPSYREGLPKSLIEAMAIGRPIVTTDVPGCRECVVDNYNGYLVPVKNSDAIAEKIDLLLDSGELRRKMGANSREKMVNELSLDIVLKDTIEFYKELI